MREAGRSKAPVQWGVCHHRQDGLETQMQLTEVKKGLSRLEATDPALEG